MNKIYPNIAAGLLAVLSLNSCQLIDEFAPPAPSPHISYVAVENNTGRIIYSANSVARRPIGMLANVATAAVVLDWIATSNISPDRRINIPQEVLQWPETNRLSLQPGDQISLRDALYSTLLWDDSASAIALAYACGYQLNPSQPKQAFLEQMNRLAGNLGMSQTNFMEVHGAASSYSTARDLALLAMYAHQKPVFQLMSTQKENVCTVYTSSGARRVTAYNTNKLLRERSDVDGIKAARSQHAGSCLIATARRSSIKLPTGPGGEMQTHPRRMSVVVLGSSTPEERYDLTRKFLTNGWSVWQTWVEQQSALRNQGQPVQQDESRFLRLPK